MQLTRRDAAAALAALGATGGAAVGTRALVSEDERPDAGPTVDDQHVRTVMSAVAVVVYPEAVSGIPAFVERFLEGRLTRPAHAAGLRAAVGELDRLAEEWHGAPVDELSPATRERLLREVGADTADADPAGTTAEQVRYYIVNELLLALYTSPAGGDLIGLENPPGHPGGVASYTHGSP